jgi:TPR repeat protein
MYGLGGFARNEEMAVSYFFRAANGSNPFPMAVHALGNYFKDSLRNLTMARKYYERAAELGSAEGHFSYAMMLREGVGGPIDIPLALVHLAVAASHNQVRSINFLAHALFDPDSWLGQYGREQKQRTYQANATLNLDRDDKKVISRFRYNVSEPIIVRIPNTNVNVLLPNPPQADCRAALPLLKHLSEMGYRPNDLSKAALQTYLQGDYWTSLQYFDELSEFGIDTSQENAVYLYKQLKPLECSSENSTRARLLHILRSSKTNMVKIEERSLLADWLADEAGDNFDIGTKGNHDSGEPTGDSYTKVLPPHLSVKECEFYFDRMIANRYMQAASLGNQEAIRELAVIASTSSTGGTHPVESNATLAAYLYALAAARGDVQSLVGLGWLLRSGGDGEFNKNRTAAAAAFEAARNWETATHSTEGVYYYDDHTFGLAPFIANVWIWCEDIADSLGLTKVVTLALNRASEMATVMVGSFSQEDAINVETPFTSSLAEIIITLKHIASVPLLLELLMGSYVVLVFIRNRRRALNSPS